MYNVYYEAKLKTTAMSNLKSRQTLLQVTDPDFI